MATRSRALRHEHCAEKRKHPRFTAQFRSSFSGGPQEGNGKTIDLSDGGCRIESDQPVVVGTSFECRIYAPDLSWPLRIDKAKVCWVRGKTFGLQFLVIVPDEQVKLKQLIANLKAEASK